MPFKCNAAGFRPIGPTFLFSITIISNAKEVCKSLIQ